MGNNKISNWIYKKVNIIENKIIESIKTEVEPKLYSIIRFVAIFTAIFCVIIFISQALGADIQKYLNFVFVIEAAIIVKILYPNIKKIETNALKRKYILLNFLVAIICGVIVSYISFIAIILLVIILILDFQSFYDKNKIKLSDGTILTEHKGICGESYYDGNDGKSYKSNDGGNTFTKN